MPPSDPTEVPSAQFVPDATVASAPRDATDTGSFAPPAHAGEVGVLGPYRLVKELGRGGMGAVYAALDTRLGRRVAIKTMLPKFAADADAKERFLREARAAGQISHENVVTVYDADERNGVPYIAMQFLKGASLDDCLRQNGELSVSQVVRIGAEAAAGLFAAHEKGLIHRDIKPANLWLEAPSGRVKVLDFGLAKPADTDRELTRSGMVVGTPAYMSPEQARGEKLDPRSDLFSLGAVLYRLLAGRLPFDGPTTMAVLTALATVDPPPLRARNPNVPEPLAALVHQLLAKSAAARPQSAAEVTARLRGAFVGETAVVAQPVPVAIPATEDNPFAGLDETDVATPLPARVATRPTGSHLWLYAGAAAVLLVAGVGAALALKGRNQPEPKAPAPEPVAKGKDPKPAPPPKPIPAVDPDRKAAEWVISLGGMVRLNGTATDIKVVADLPKEPFRLTSVNLIGRPVTDAGLATLVELKSLAELCLEGTTVTDAGLAHLKDMYSLGKLDLNGTKVTDAGLSHLSDLSSLSIICLNDTAVTDAGLVTLKGLPALWQLYLSRTRVTDVGMVHLRDVKRLNLLELCNTQVTDAGVAHIGAHAGLGHLNLSGTAVTDAGLVHLKGLNLYALRANDTKVSDAGLAHLAGMTEMRHLQLMGTAVGDSGLATLAEMPWLAVVSTHRSRVTRPGLAAFHAAAPGCAIEADGGYIEAEDVNRKAAEWVLSAGGSVKVSGQDRDISAATADLPKERFTLSAVDLNDRPVTDADLTNLRHLYDLSTLKLNNTKMTDTGLVTVGRLRGLTTLWVWGAAITDAGLAHLRPLHKLDHLSLAFTPITDAGLVHLADLKGMKRLGLEHTKVTGTGLGELVRLPELSELWLKSTSLRDDSLVHLTGCKNLQSLILTGCPTTDTGLKHLERCPRLTRLNVRETKVTADGVTKFTTTVPACTIESDLKK